MILISLAVFILPQNNSPSDKQTTHWGVDSAVASNDGLYECVSDNFVKPDVFGRYLGNQKDVSDGLTEKEVSYLHEKNVGILLIYNHVTEATTKEQGVDHAKQAIDLAKELDAPKGVALFVDIEPNYKIDAVFLNGWYETIEDSSYEAGIYGVFDDDNALMEAYNQAEIDVQKKMIIWTAYPQKEITSNDEAPKFESHGPEHGKVYGWQYPIDTEDCTVDTNLFSSDMMKYLWK